MVYEYAQGEAPAVSSTTTTTVTTTTTTTTSTSSANTGDDKTVYGDANCDGTVDIADAVLIMQSLSNPDKYGIKGSDELHITEQGLRNADCCSTGDGVTTNDALLIQLYKLNLVKSLPGEISE